jgi:hypothetical protein
VTDIWIQYSNLVPGGFGRVMLEDQFNEATEWLRSGLEKYALHLWDCPANDPGDGECRCGLANLLNRKP